MKKILVTGGMGFIGSNFIQYMLEKYDKYTILNLDSLTYAGNRSNCAEFQHANNYSFIQGDITDKAFVENVMDEGIDFVVHFAAESHVDRSIHDPSSFVMTNVLGTQCLLDAARRHNVSRFVHISTDEVYGSLGKTGYFTENSDISPNSPYAASKASSDLIALAYYHTYKFPVLITRCSNNYGPRQCSEKFIPMVITNAAMNQSIPIYGDGQNIRDWLHVQDHCAAIDLVLHGGTPGKAYNIGGNNEQTNIAISSYILNEMNGSTHLLQFVADRLGHDLRYAIDASKIRRELGWQPMIPFEQGLRDTIAWYLDNKAWWEGR